MLKKLKKKYFEIFKNVLGKSSKNSQKAKKQFENVWKFLKPIFCKDWEIVKGWHDQILKLFKHETFFCKFILFYLKLIECFLLIDIYEK